MQKDEWNLATERLNAGAEIPVVSPSIIKGMWEAISRIPKEQRQNKAIGLGAFALMGPADMPQDPEQQVALMARYALLDGLVEQGVLSEYMDDLSQREKVFAAAARFPCNKEDLGEAIARKMINESSPEAAQKILEEFRGAGYDPEHLKVAEKIKQWMRDN